MFAKIKECKKKYTEEHKEDLKEYNKQHYQEHKEEISEQKKIYRTNNDAKIKESKSKKYDCPCGGKYCHSEKARHYKTQKHLKYIKENPDVITTV